MELQKESQQVDTMTCINIVNVSIIKSCTLGKCPNNPHSVALPTLEAQMLIFFPYGTFY